MSDPVIHVSQDQVCCDLHGEAVILSLKTGQYYGLDDVGSRVWELIQEPKTVSQLQSEIVSEFDVDAAVCQRDVQDLLRNLTSAGLIEIRP